LRVIEAGGEDHSRFMLLNTRDNYRVLDTTRPNPKQVLYVYSFSILYIAWIVGYVAYGADVSTNWRIALWFAALAIPFIVPYGLRWYAKRDALR